MELKLDSPLLQSSIQDQMAANLKLSKKEEVF